MLVDEIVQSCSILMKPAFDTKKVKLSVSSEKNLKIFADKNQVKQSIINFMINALDSVSEKMQKESGFVPVVYLKAYTTANNICIEVLDKGMGMTEEKIKKAVEPFYTTKKDGTGIGLFIAKQYTEENGGVLFIESQENMYTKIILKFER